MTHTAEKDALARVAALASSWVGFDDSHHYGDAVLKAIGPDELALLSPGGDALRGRIDKLADLAAEHMNCSGCPTPWWLVNWLAEEASARVIPPTETR